MPAQEAFAVAQPRVAAGALFRDENGRILLVKPTYKERWDIPGGYVEPGETPRQACGREVMEELALDRPVGRLLAVDWAPMPGEGDKLLFVFDGGQLDESEIEQIALPPEELKAFKFFEQGELSEVLTARLIRRITAASAALAGGDVAYLEAGHEPAPSQIASKS
ncbi:NUDIX domain-containing protein [Kribbella deserti]|uniref:NUDIX domain-containing protein n=1 Tax=Kribbella deserti TaxID=1926257 RepID=A0ABV6QQZ3_9ACTN